MTLLFNKREYIYFIKISDNSYKISTKVEKNSIYCVVSNGQIIANSEIIEYIKTTMAIRFNECDFDELSRILYFNNIIKCISISQLKLKNKYYDSKL